MRHSRDSRSVQRHTQQKGNLRKSVAEHQAGLETAPGLVSSENTHNTCASSLQDINDSSKTAMQQKEMPENAPVEDSSQPTAPVKQTKTPITRPKEVYPSRLYELLDGLSEASPDKSKLPTNEQILEENGMNAVESPQMVELLTVEPITQGPQATHQPKTKRSKQQYLNADKGKKRGNKCEVGGK